MPAIRRTSLAALTLLVSVVLLAPQASAAPYRRPMRVERVSVGVDGIQGNGQAPYGTISSNADFIVFTSAADNLVPDDTNGRTDVFVRMHATGSIRRVSVASDGTQANNDSSAGTISDDGKRVAFASWANNLVPEPTTVLGQIFEHDLETGRTRLVSVSSSGQLGNAFSFDPTISANGRFVAFESSATNLVPNDTNLSTDPMATIPQDIFVRDLVAGTTERVSVGLGGVDANGTSRWPLLSADGRYVTFASTATNLVPADTNIASDPLFRGEDVYLYDRQTDVTELISVSSDGTHGAGASFGFAPITPDGRYVAFFSQAPNLVPNDSNRVQDAFVRDRLTGVTERVSVSSSGGESNNSSLRPSISSDGRFVAFSSLGTNVVPNDGNAGDDIYVHDRSTGETRIISLSEEGEPALGQNFVPTMSSDGRFVAFSAYSALVPDDDNQTYDTYLVDNGPLLGVQKLTAERNGAGLDVSGAVALSSTVATSADDPSGDAPGGPAGADLTNASISYRPELDDLLFTWRTTAMPSAPTAVWTQPGAGGTPALTYATSFAYGGSTWEVSAVRIPVDGDTTNPRFRLSRCTPACTVVSTLGGGIGTRGNVVQAAVPMSSLSATSSALTSVRASVAIPGVTQGADEVDLPGTVPLTQDVLVGVAPSGTPAGSVDFREAGLSEGRFSVSIAPIPSGPSDLWVRVCLLTRCVDEKTSVE